MKLVAYSIHDDKSESYNTPYFAQNDNMAKRSFADLVRDPSTTISKNPEDFRLYRVGEFINDDGKLYQEEIPTLVASATDYTDAI